MSGFNELSIGYKYLHLHHQTKTDSVIEKFKTLPPMSVGVSTITVAELEFGVEKSSKKEENHEAIQRFLLPLIIVPFEINIHLAMEKYRIF